MNYKVTKVKGGYIMTRENSDTQTIKVLPTIKDLRENDKKKIVAVSKSLHSKYFNSDIYIMRDADCDALMGVQTRRPLNEITDKFVGAESKSIEEYTGVLLVLRQQIYDYLSGKLTHAEFIKVYKDFESFLGQRGLTQVNGEVENDFEKSQWSNGWMPDNENDDDEYYNDYLEAEHLNRDININFEVIVSVQQWQDEADYVVMFKVVDELC